MRNVAISSPRSSEKTEKFVVRLPKGMRENIAELANQHHRSMNSEIVSRLERSIALERLALHPESLSPPLNAREEKLVVESNGWANVSNEDIIRQLSILPPKQKQALLTVLFSINS